MVCGRDMLPVQFDRSRTESVMSHKRTPEITELILEAGKTARQQTGNKSDPTVVTSVEWPVDCTVGPGLEGAIACVSQVGYVNGSQGRLSYRGYDVFDLCAYSSYEEVSYLLLHGDLPSAHQLTRFKKKLTNYLNIPSVLRELASFPVEEMNSMAALRLGTNLMRHGTELELETGAPDTSDAIASDEDSIPMETVPKGEEHAIYEFVRKNRDRETVESCLRVVSGLASITAAISRIRMGTLPIVPDENLSHAGNFLYMMTGEVPTAEEERIMDVALILHADHGVNASTFASLVVASTLSDIFSSVIAGIGALTGPLHGGANEQVVRMLKEIDSVDNVKSWCRTALKNKRKIMGVGHRVYRSYDPRARILGPLAEYLAREHADIRPLHRIAVALEKEVDRTLGKKGLFPNVDFYSGIVYKALGVPEKMFTPIFAVSRVSGWTARILEYLEHNRIFRPRVMYSGRIDQKYVPVKDRGRTKASGRRGRHR